jgi:sec-independent protein translocase protein TatB
MALLFLESVGTTELLVIVVVALVVFGPRKLPELARSLGKSLNEFKRASDDFKRTWEREVEVERIERQEHVDRAMIDAPDTDAAPPAEHTIAPSTTLPPRAGEQIARGAEAMDAPAAVPAAIPAIAPEAPTTEPTRKSDWL